MLRRHFDLMVEVFGEEHRGSLQFRKVAPWYAKRFGPVKPFAIMLWYESAQRQTSKKGFAYLSALGDYLEWRKSFTDDTGNLLPRYQLPSVPMIASFMKEEDEFQSTQRKEIGVPKGPVEVW